MLIYNLSDKEDVVEVPKFLIKTFLITFTDKFNKKHNKTVCPGRIAFMKTCFFYIFLFIGFITLLFMICFYILIYYLREIVIREKELYLIFSNEVHMHK